MKEMRLLKAIKQKKFEHKTASLARDQTADMGLLHSHDDSFSLSNVIVIVCVYFFHLCIAVLKGDLKMKNYKKS